MKIGDKLKFTDKPWGMECLLVKTEKYAGKVIEINAGHRLSLQHHNIKMETLVLLKGIMDVNFGLLLNQLTYMRLEPGDTFHLPPGTIHRMTAIEDCLLLEVSTPELDDVIRHEDDYGRTD